MADEVAEAHHTSLAAGQNADDYTVAIHQFVVRRLNSGALGYAFDLAEYGLASFALAV